MKQISSSGNQKKWRRKVVNIIRNNNPHNNKMTSSGRIIPWINNSNRISSSTCPGGEMMRLVRWTVALFYVTFCLGIRSVDALKCVCNPKECDIVRSTECPGKGLIIWDPCKWVGMRFFSLSFNICDTEQGEHALSIDFEIATRS